MTQKDDYESSPSFLNKRFIKFIAIATAVVIISVFVAAFIKYGISTSNMILSDYFFIVGIVLLILGVLMRTVAWVVHKRFVLKPNNDNEYDVFKARIVLKFLSKTFSFVGFINVIVSLIFLVLYYNE
ncbi:hypothetical protein [Proteiniborus sp.]|uniref:hypothetical protein n=1 Tax=Proteiniborus sp. TaxID=2079015 RepID=UPI0033272D80